MADGTITIKGQFASPTANSSGNALSGQTVYFYYAPNNTNQQYFLGSTLAQFVPGNSTTDYFAFTTQVPAGTYSGSGAIVADVVAGNANVTVSATNFNNYSGSDYIVLADGTTPDPSPPKPRIRERRGRQAAPNIIS